MTETNPFDAWVKGKVVIMSCGCRVEHGQNPVGGQVVFCAKDSAEIRGEDEDLAGTPAPV